MDKFVKLSAAATVNVASGGFEAVHAWKAVKARFATL